MINQYNHKLDRLITHNSVTSNYSNSFHDFIMDELELGARVALAINEPEQAWWEIVGNQMYTEYMSDSSKGDL